MTVDISSLKNLGDPLVEFAEVFGIDLSEFKTCEGVEKFTFNEEKYSGSNRSQYSAQKITNVLLGLVEAYGDALSLQFIFGGVPILDVATGISIDKVEKLIQKFTQSMVRIDLVLEKHKLLASLFPPENHPHVRVKLFFFPERLKSALLMPLYELEGDNGLWHDVDDQSRLVILLPTHEINLVGSNLVILGGTELQDLEKHLELAAPLPKELPERMRQKVLAPNSPVKWGYFKIAKLTPVHLAAKGFAGANDEIAQVLYTQLVNLCILYTANRTIGPAKGSSEWQATFTEQALAIDVKWNDDQLLPGSKDESWSAPLVWYEIVCQAYRDERYTSDYLKIVQITVARRLGQIQNKNLYEELVDQTLEIEKEIDRLWKMFIEGQIKAYFGQLAGIEKAIDAFTEKAENQFDELSRSVTDNALASVGVLVGTFIAAAFRGEFNVALFWVGTTAYLLYLLFFPFWLGLKASKERFDIASNTFKQQKKIFSSRLGKSTVNEIIGKRVKNWASRYRIAYRRAKRVYLSVALVLVLMASLVTWVASSNYSNDLQQTNTPTPITQTQSPTLSTESLTPKPTIPNTQVP